MAIFSAFNPPQFSTYHTDNIEINGAISATFSDLTTGYMGANGASDDEIREASQIFNPIFAAITSGGDQSQFGINSGLNTSLTENNYLNHGQRARAEQLHDYIIENCQGEFPAADCDAKHAEVANLKLLSEANTLALQNSCNASMSSSECQDHMAAMSDYVGWVNDSFFDSGWRSQYDVAIGQYYHDSLRGEGADGLDQSILAAYENNIDIVSDAGSTLSELDDQIHHNNSMIPTVGNALFGEADRLQHQGELLTEFEGLNDTNDPIEFVSCGSNEYGDTQMCPSSRRHDIRTYLLLHGIADFALPSTSLDLALEVVGLGVVNDVVMRGGKMYARVDGNEIQVYRVFGDDARAQGASWTTVDPRSVDNFRNEAGLPSGGPSGSNNSADFLLTGQANTNDVILTRPALPLDGNDGGVEELIIKPENVEITDFSVLNQ